MRRFALLILVCNLASCGRPREPFAFDGQPTIRVAQAAMTGGSPEIAVNVARSILSHDAYNIPAQLILGDAFYAMQLYPQAEAAYGAVAKIQPSNGPAHLGLGRIRLTGRDFTGAELEFRLAAQQAPEPQAYSNLGVALDLQERHAAAQEEYRRALALDPGSAATRVNLALSLLSSGDREGARAALAPVVGSPENADVAGDVASAQRAIESQASPTTGSAAQTTPLATGQTLGSSPRVQPRARGVDPSQEPNFAAGASPAGQPLELNGMPTRPAIVLQPTAEQRDETSQPSTGFIVLHPQQPIRTIAPPL